jgi:hypothetical protein
VIRYPQALDGIEGAIDRQSDTWLTRAAERTALFARLGGYAESYRDLLEHASRPQPSSVQPRRYSRRRKPFASGELVTRPATPSYSIFLPAR